MASLGEPPPTALKAGGIHMPPDCTPPFTPTLSRASIKMIVSKNTNNNNNKKNGK